MDLRIGQGIDIHQFDASCTPFILGGVEIPHDKGLQGHSDADALLHAITDAVLGAVGMGDIGAHFPDTDPQWKGADSAVLLTEVWKTVTSQGWELVNLDATVLTELPKLSPHISRMRERIAGLLTTEPGRISVKATTSEKMGFVGRGEGLLASCVVLLSK